MTAPESHTILSDALEVAGVYVGLTRGREANRLYVVAVGMGDAREQFVAALERDHADRGLREATERAQLAVAGIVADGPVQEVNAERARIAERIRDAEKRAAWWSKAADRLDRQTHEHRTAHDEQQEKLSIAQGQAEVIRAEVVVPLVGQAIGDAALLATARDRVRDADAALPGAARLRRRNAARIQQAAGQELREAETSIHGRWGSAPAFAIVSASSSGVVGGFFLALAARATDSTTASR
jgi:hypothetical protein